MMSIYTSILNDELIQIRSEARRFAEQEILPYAYQWEEDEWFPKSLHKKAGDLGFLGVGFDEEVGGAGGGALHMLMVIEGLMRGSSTGVVVGLSSVGIAVPPLIAAKQDDLIQRYVKPALSGNLIAALAVTEPQAGSDVAGIKTRAALVDDHYHVTGNKTFITSGKRADYFTTLVRTSDHPHLGLTFLVIDSTQKGIIVSQPLKKTGWRASDTVEIHFDNVKVPVKNRVSAEGSGFLLVMKNFQMERLALAAYGVVTAQICFDEALAYAQTRKAFGKSLTGFQTTRHKLADMLTEITAAQALVYQVAQALDEGKEVIAEVSMAKNFCAQIAQKVCYEAVQIFGGMGYMRENLVERLSRDARLLPIGGGTQEIMKEIITKRMAW